MSEFNPNTHCHDCGTEGHHQDSPGKCRRCHTNAGYGQDFISSIDHDALRAFVGERLANDIIELCQAQGTSEPGKERLDNLRIALAVMEDEPAPVSLRLG